MCSIRIVKSNQIKLLQNLHQQVLKCICIYVKSAKCSCIFINFFVIRLWSSINLPLFFSSLFSAFYIFFIAECLNMNAFNEHYFCLSFKQELDTRKFLNCEDSKTNDKYLHIVANATLSLVLMCSMGRFLRQNIIKWYFCQHLYHTFTNVCICIVAGWTAFGFEQPLHQRKEGRSKRIFICYICICICICICIALSRRSISGRKEGQSGSLPLDLAPG